jgi:carbon-monoxide dehydrogenase small subunit
MSDEETRAQSPEDSSSENEQTKAMTRRQFLIGSGVSLVVGAAGMGAMTPQTAEAAKTVPANQPASAPGVAQPVPGAPRVGPAPATAAADLPPSQRIVTLNINGKDYTTTVDVRMSLWEVMTYMLGMSGSNVGCDRAQCGACTVTVDGRAVNGCTVLAARLGRGQKILTVEGLGKGNRVEDLHPIQKAYWQDGGFQCGICTRGFIMATYALLIKNPTPNETDIQEALGGNICRCSEYPKIYESVYRAAEAMRKKA